MKLAATAGETPRGLFGMACDHWHHVSRMSSHGAGGGGKDGEQSLGHKGFQDV